MKKTIALCCTILLLFSLLAGCQQAPKEEGKLLVYTSFYTMGDFTKKIGGDHITVVNLVPAGTEPHDWEPSPQNMQGLAEADIFVYNGAGIESWVDDVLISLDRDDLLVVKTSTHLSLLSGEDVEEDHDDHDDHDHEEDDGHNHGAYDPHTWLAPLNAMAEMQEIMKALQTADPTNADYYEGNFNLQRDRLLQLDADYHNRLAPLSTRDIVVAHSAYGYLCQAYDLHQVAVKGFSPDTEPSPKKMAEVIDFVRENNVSTIFFEPTSSPAVAQAIANNTGASIALLSPIESVSKKDQANRLDYFTVMESNLDALVEALT